VPSELVGRDRELAAVADLLAAALAGDGRLVLCGGEPGIGRTRLAAELAVRATADGIPVAWGAAAEPDAGPPFLPWRQVLRGLPDIAGPLGGAADLAPLVPGGAPTTGGGADRFRLFDAVVRVLHAAAEPAGLLVVLDDVHRADPASLLLLDHVAGQLRGARVLLLATYDDTAAPPVLPGGSAVERMVLRRLAPNAVAAQLAAATGGAVPAEQARRVHELTGGNPFLVAELARDLGEGRPISVPAGVREAVGRRLGRLSPRCRHELRAAAVLGRRFDLAVLAAAIGRPLLECLDPIDEATAVGLLEPGDAPGEHRFVHALVRDTIEAGLPAGERVRLHRAAVDAIHRHAGDRLDPYLGDLARHWAVAAVAGERAVAAGWIERAAGASVHALAFEEGARLYRLALDTGHPDLDAAAPTASWSPWPRPASAPRTRPGPSRRRGRRRRWPASWLGPSCSPTRSSPWAASTTSSPTARCAPCARRRSTSSEPGPPQRRAEPGCSRCSPRPPCTSRTSSGPRRPAGRHSPSRSDAETDPRWSPRCMRGRWRAAGRTASRSGPRWPSACSPRPATATRPACGRTCGA